MNWTTPSIGIVTTAQLRRNGWHRREQERAIARGRLVVLRRGVYAFSGAEPELMNVIRNGGVITCVTALRKYQVWTPAGRAIHQRHRTCPPGECRPYGPTPTTAVLDPLPTCLLAAARCLSEEDFVAVLDSVLHRRLMTRAQLTETLSVAPQRVRQLLQRVDTAESGSESLVRQRLRSLGIKLQPQVRIDRVGRVDFLIGDRLVLEVDSIEHHTSRENYFNDRRRDRQLIVMGYLPIRITYHDVMYRWPDVEAVILSLVRRRKHLRRSVQRPVASRRDHDGREAA